jgi:hypothetical protein
LLDASSLIPHVFLVVLLPKAASSSLAEANIYGESLRALQFPYIQHLLGWEILWNWILMRPTPGNPA